MNVLGKTIKYTAIALAMLLAVTVIGSVIDILAVFFGDTEEVEMKEYTVDNSVFKIEAELQVSELIIENAQNFKVLTNNGDVSIKEANGVLRIIEKRKPINISHKKNAEVRIYIPENNNLEGLNIKAGVGKANIKVSEISDLKLEMGVGELTLKSTLLGKNEIHCGIGAIDITLTGDNDSYKVKAAKGIGEIRLDGRKIGSGTFGEGNSLLEIEGGIGNIRIAFEDD
ncbi:MAG: hypothetical protein IJ323_06355 [Clostridia bacterium]|nr:hypothetical protein [Clostridia bacterium]